jgi:glycosyltransferase involved in cell wall biosynthesis
VRVLFVHNGLSRFIEIDRALIAERHDVAEWHQVGRIVDIARLRKACASTDLVFGWFASWHTFWPMTLARMLGKPTVLVIGGYDVARMPEVGYGSQRGGLRKWIARSTISRAHALTTVSFASLNEIRENLGAVADRVRVIYHGVPDVWGLEPPLGKQRMVMTAATVNHTTLAIKGHRNFVAAAKHLPDVNFVLAGGDGDGTLGHLQKVATPNVRFLGQLEPTELDRYYGQASVYVQASLHESFGMAVAESMLAGCIPVVTRVGALPEVVGDTGVTLASGEPADIAEGIRHAIDKGPTERLRARDRILAKFPIARRRDELLDLLELTR